jgi:hypothetical protein
MDQVVALSSDGNVLAAGNGIGTVHVFSRSGTGWTQQAHVASVGAADYQIGGEVALSADGNTLVAGANADGSTLATGGARPGGAVIVFE